MESVAITIGKEVFRGRLRDDLAPRTCAAFRSLVPFVREVIHARWSGEACWVPLGDLDLGVGIESPTSCPAPGQLLYHPRGISESELLVPYGKTRFACEAGPLCGSPFLTIIDRLDRLAEIGAQSLWLGAQQLMIAPEGPNGSPQFRPE